MVTYQHPCFREIEVSYFARESNAGHHGGARRPESPPERDRIDDVDVGPDRKMPLAVASQDIAMKNEIRQLKLGISYTAVLVMRFWSASKLISSFPSPS
jgi:hypothetical protein